MSEEAVETPSESVQPEGEVTTPEPAPEPTPEPSPEEPAPEPEAYTPNLTYKVKDQELTFDETFKDLVKSKDVEEKLRDLYTKSSGLDEVVRSRNELKQNYEGLRNGISEVVQLVQKGRVFDGLSALGIKKEQILAAALEEAQYQELSPEQKAEYDRRRDLQVREHDLSKENQIMTERLQKLEVQVRTGELNAALARSDIRDVASFYDTRLGQEGAFRNQVIQYANNVHLTTGEDLSAEQAALAVASQFKAFLPSGPQASNTGQAQPEDVTYIRKRETPAIPQRGKGGNPTKKAITSIDQLRELHKQNQNNL